jgi:cysteine desulfurase
MMQTPVYLDNHATTRVDPRVVAAMLPYFTEKYGNPASTNHVFGSEGHDAIEQARCSIARALNAETGEIVFTSGATESNNLALRGLTEHRRRKGNRVISAQTEHKSVLDPIRRLSRHDVSVTLLPVAAHDAAVPGRLDVSQLADALTPDTFLVSIMLANSEIGVVQPLANIGACCRQRGIALHCDATQAVGRLPIDVQALQVDLLSFSGHKFYGPKGIGALYVRREIRARLASQLDGGGQERGTRSGTLNVPGIIGLARAVELCLADLEEEQHRIGALRQRLWDQLQQRIPGAQLNGPPLEDSHLRLRGNLNCHFPGVEGSALMLAVPEIAFSTGSACTSLNPEPSHVLRALGLDVDLVRSSVRFGIGRFTTDEEIDWAADRITNAVRRLRHQPL